MAAPKLRVRASGLGGSGYKLVTEPGQPVVPGVTTVLGAIDKPAITQWAVNQVVAYAVANIDSLLTRTEEAGRGFLQWYWKRGKESDFDDPAVDIRDIHNIVLDDAAQLGTHMHDYVEAVLKDDPFSAPELFRQEHFEMAEQFQDWLLDHDVKVNATELTVVGNGYAGTADLYVEIDGEPWLIDIKTSRGIWPEHFAQLAALGAASYAVTDVPEGTEGAVKYKGEWFKETEIPPFTRYGILHLRPSDTDSQGEYMHPFCLLKEVSHAKIDAAFQMFLGALEVRKAQKAIKDIEKGEL